MTTGFREGVDHEPECDRHARGMDCTCPQERIAADAILAVLRPLTGPDRVAVMERVFDETDWCRHCMEPGCRGVCDNDE